MINLWPFKKQCVLEFGIRIEHNTVFNLFKPNDAKKFVPKWFKDLNPQIIKKTQIDVGIPQSTIKKCPGIRGVITNGIILPLWTDIVIEFDKNTLKYECADGRTNIEVHSRSTYNNFLDGYVDVKILNPWLVKCNMPKTFLFTAPLYHRNKKELFYTPPGMLEFYYQHSLNVNLMFPVNCNPYRIVLNAGEPIAQLIDTTNEKTIIKHEMLDNAEYFKKYVQYPVTYMDNYKLYKKFKNESKTN